MKAFRLNEYEWYAAETYAAAVDKAMEDSGLPYEDVVDDMFVTGRPESDSLEVWADESCTIKTTCGEIVKGMSEPGFAFGKEW